MISEPPEQTNNIALPDKNDVVCGRGSAANRHVGNTNFRELVRWNKSLYVQLTKREKMAMAREIYDAIKSQKPPGRFLQRDPSTDKWFDIGKPRALEKISQALREKSSSLCPKQIERSVLSKQVSSEDESPRFPLTSTYKIDDERAALPLSPEWADAPNSRGKGSPTQIGKVLSHRRVAFNGITIPPQLDSQFNVPRKVSGESHKEHSPHQTAYRNFGPETFSMIKRPKSCQDSSLPRVPHNDKIQRPDPLSVRSISDDSFKKTSCLNDRRSQYSPVNGGSPSYPIQQRPSNMNFPSYHPYGNRHEYRHNLNHNLPFKRSYSVHNIPLPSPPPPPPPSSDVVPSYSNHYRSCYDRNEISWAPAPQRPYPYHGSTQNGSNPPLKWYGPNQANSYASPPSSATIPLNSRSSPDNLMQHPHPVISPEYSSPSPEVYHCVSEERDHYVGPKCPPMEQPRCVYKKPRLMPTNEISNTNKVSTQKKDETKQQTISQEKSSVKPHSIPVQEEEKHICSSQSPFAGFGGLAALSRAASIVQNGYMENTKVLGS